MDISTIGTNSEVVLKFFRCYQNLRKEESIINGSQNRVRILHQPMTCIWTQQNTCLLLSTRITSLLTWEPWLKTVFTLESLDQHCFNFLSERPEGGGRYSGGSRALGDISLSGTPVTVILGEWPGRNTWKTAWWMQIWDWQRSTISNVSFG